MVHLTRYYIYKKIEECFPDKITGNILCIGDTELKHIIRKDANITYTYYPEVDFQNLPYDNETFDYIISDQVLEHLENPIKAINESHRILKKRGIAIHTTCFINYIHVNPIDYWRFSPECLKYLCSDFSEIINYGGWGNRIAIFLSWTRFRMIEIPENKFSIRNIIGTFNETKYPLSTWIIARK